MKRTTYFQVIIWTVAILIITVVSSCGSKDDDDEKAELPKQEDDKEVVVTGSSVEAGITFAIITGSVYLNRIPAAMTYENGAASLKVGVELSTRSDFGTNSTCQLLANGLEGNKLTVSTDTLSANTTYYYRAFVRVGDFSLYGEKQSFTTKDFDSPTLTGEVADITFTSAIISYTTPNVSLSDNETIGTAIAYSTDKNNLRAENIKIIRNSYGERDLNWEGVNFSTGNYWNRLDGNTTNETLSGLKPDQTYYYCLFTCAGSKFKLSEIKSFKTLGLDASLLTTGDADNITFATANITGSTTLPSTISRLYANDISVSCGISYVPESEYYPSDEQFPYVVTLPEMKDGTFSVGLESLAPETTYLFRAFARVGETVLVGDVKRFKTKPIKDYLFINVTDIGFKTASFEGKTLLPSMFENVNYTLYYTYKMDDFNWDQQTTPVVSGENITATLNSLMVGRPYEYWLTATIGRKDYQSEKKTFTTVNPGDYIKLDEVTDVKSTSAVISGFLDPKAYDTETFCHIYYGTDKNNLFQLTTAPVNNDHFTLEIKNLRSNTTYYYRVQALCHLDFGSADWFSSETKSFTTLP